MRTERRIKKFRLEIQLGNAAMQTAEDIARALRKLAMRIDAGCTGSLGTIYDLNGNVVGSYRGVP